MQTSHYCKCSFYQNNNDKKFYLRKAINTQQQRTYQNCKLQFLNRIVKYALVTFVLYLKESEVTALHTYKGKEEEHELSFEYGDLIKIVKIVTKVNLKNDKINITLKFIHLIELFF